MKIKELTASERIALLGRLVSEAHGAIADMGWKNGTKKPSRWMLEAEEYFALYGSNEDLKWELKKPTSRRPR